MIFSSISRMASVLMAVSVGFITCASLHADLAIYDVTTTGTITGEGKTTSVTYKGVVAIDLENNDVAILVHGREGAAHVYKVVSGGWQIQQTVGAHRISQTVASYTETVDGVQGFSFLKGTNALVSVNATELSVVVPKTIRGTTSIVDQRDEKSYFTLTETTGRFDGPDSRRVNREAFTLSSYVAAEEAKFVAKGYVDASIR